MAQQRQKPADFRRPCAASDWAATLSTSWQLAEKLGVDPTQACSTIANFLPTVANAASPNGEVQQHDNILGGYGQQVIQVKVKLCSTPHTLITGF